MDQPYVCQTCDYYSVVGGQGICNVRDPEDGPVGPNDSCKYHSSNEDDN